MNGISDTIARLSPRGGARGPAFGFARADDRLEDLTAFGSNPGALRARMYVPEGLAPAAALVVVLHGCTQNAAGYDHGAGWSQLADRNGFVLLFPEQQRSNNPNLCFNWFQPGDTRRDAGEALSIRQMTAAMITRHKLDPARVFVTGLSAGGAMAAVMLATYPELFAGGAIIAGLPYGVASSVQEALERMGGRGLPDRAELARLVRRASDHRGPWPTISIWHGDADRTVNPSNAEALSLQWRELHGVAGPASDVEQTDTHRRRTWRDDAGLLVVDDYLVSGMGHGTPLDTDGDDGCGVSGPHMLQVELSSTRLIARGWGLIETAVSEPAAETKQPEALTAAPATAGGERRSPYVPIHLPEAIERTIKDALRKAGLLG